MISCKVVLLLCFWFGLQCARHGPAWDLVQRCPLDQHRAQAEVWILLTILLIQSQAHFLLDHRPYFKLSKAVHEINKIQHWALAKALWRTKSPALVCRSYNEIKTTYHPAGQPGRINGPPAWDRKGKRVSFWKNKSQHNAWFTARRFCLPQCWTSITHFGAHWAGFSKD